MPTENIFDEEKENLIEEIIFKALSLQSKEEILLYLEQACGGRDSALFSEVMESPILLWKINSNDEKSAELKEGNIVGNYVIKGEINKGGTAKVYVGEHQILKVYAAIKVFEDEQHLIWMKDHKSLSRLSHDNIVKFYDVGEHFVNGRKLYFIIYELVKGKHLDEYCSEKELDIQEILILFIELTSVIAYIHSEKIEHSDLKPNNIMVTAKRPHQIKLIDFGSSRFRREGLRRLTSNDFFGTFSSFAAPEQFDKNNEADHQSDIYSLGAILYLLLTGKLPFADADKIVDPKISAVAPSEKILDCGKDDKFGLTVKKLSKIYKGDLDYIVLKCLAKRRKNRYHSVADLTADLKNFIHGKPLKSKQIPVGYKLYKPLLAYFGIKNTAVGWKRWKKAIIRLSAAGLGVFLLLFFLTWAGKRWYRQTPNYDAKLSGIKKDQLYRVRKDDTVIDGYLIKDVITLSLNDEPFIYFVPVKIDNDIIYMSRFEITNRQWKTVAKMEKVKLPMKENGEGDDLPHVGISYYEALEFCIRLSNFLKEKVGTDITVRLPTKNEWEAGCQSGNESKYGTGNIYRVGFNNTKFTIPESKYEKSSITANSTQQSTNNDNKSHSPMNFESDDFVRYVVSKLGGKPLPQSHFDSNSYGLAAMNGNVWEMTADTKPAGAPEFFILKGGSFASEQSYSECKSNQDGHLSTPGNDQLGFRIVVAELKTLTFPFPKQ